ncbi:MAG: HAD family hydrolase [Clostridia bacterium]|nr:HAD family hydrolase [Clostridia bacterium]
MINSEALKEIKILAFDLDGTLLDGRSRISDRVKETLIKATEMGLNVVIATGRAISTIPDEVLHFPGIRYAVTSNGARIYDLVANESVYSNLLTADAVEAAMPWISDPDVMKELFFDGDVLADSHALLDMPRFGITDEHQQNYHRSTRKPCEDTVRTLRENADHIENINLIFADNSKRLKYREELSKIEGITVVSSAPYNIELGGATTSKANALKTLAEMLGYGHDNIIAFGDSTNDAHMLQCAAVGVAMGNAVEELKAVADWVTLPNTEDGVAFALASLLGIRS